MKILLETMAGQGTNLGSSLEELQRILNGVENAERMGICLDTAHVFQSGYNLIGYQRYDDFMNLFDNIIGIDKISVIHLNDSRGIELQWSHNNLISNNTASFNRYIGYYLGYSDNNILIDNVALKNSVSGIHIIDSENNKLLRNVVFCNFNDGINMWQSSYNLFTENIISFNFDMGVYIDKQWGSGINNIFYNNTFEGNRINVVDRDANDIWNNSVIGNYWGDYTGYDLDNDSIGDEPYFFLGGIDFLPIFKEDEIVEIIDKVDPIITIIIPIINETVGRDAPSFNIYVNEKNLDLMWYTVDGGTNNVTFTENGTIDKFLWESLWDTLTNGDFIKLRFYANDTSGNLGWAEVSVIKFEILPALSGFSNTKQKQKEGDKNVDSEVDSFTIGFIIVVSVSGLISALSFIRKCLKKIASKFDGI